MRGAARTAAVAVLLAVTAAGLRSRGAFSRAPDEALRGASGSVLAAALIAAEGIALAAFILLLAMARPRRKPPDEDEPPRPPFPWWAKTTAVLAAVAVLVTPFAVLLVGHTGHQIAPSAPRSVRPASPGLTAPAHESPWPLIAGMAVAVAVVVAMTLLSRSRKTRPAGPEDRARRLALAESLAAAQAALAGPRNPRQAIIACYVAMERGFAAAGSVPAAADTPAEVLARATATGLIRSGSAASLTGLFRRARYSDEPMTGADAQAAAAALDSMQASLRAGTGPAGTGPAGTPP